MKKFFIIVLMVFALMGMSCADDELVSSATAELITIQSSGGTYLITLAGYKAGSWWRSAIIVEIDSNVPGGHPIAKFVLRNGHPNDNKLITLTFNNMEEARDTLTEADNK